MVAPGVPRLADRCLPVGRVAASARSSAIPCMTHGTSTRIRLQSASSALTCRHGVQYTCHRGQYRLQHTAIQPRDQSCAGPQWSDLPSYIQHTADHLYIDRRLPVSYHTILIANRGEIACRVIRTCRQLGIRTVTVHSDIDASSQHVLLSDVSYNIGGNAAADSYLCADKILDVCQMSGAQAVHPGYGFLSENAAFARQCAERGIAWIGPPTSAIISMGSKAESKNIMQAANVPCYHGEQQSVEYLLEQAEQVGYPLMIKAVSGGGGKGMRIVRARTDFADMLESCKRESLKSFADDRVLLERYIERPRHIEFQIFADQHGNAVHLFERDCSVQRRHQKVLEEAPAPGMTDHLRQQMGQAAVNAALAVGYVGAGTVEFIVDTDAVQRALLNGSSPDDCYYFMEMNTRLQVEHPVTEMVVRKDLVQLQLHVAAGHKLPFTQAEVLRGGPFGHAIEARIYAEDPTNNFLPQTGALQYIQQPENSQYVRVESGVVTGDSVSMYYDPMIAKVIAWGSDRVQALNTLHRSLCGYHIVGPPTNIDFVANCINNQQFVRGQVDTGFIAQHIDQLLPTSSVDNTSCVIAAMYIMQQERHTSGCSWLSLESLRLNQRAHCTRRISLKHKQSATDVVIRVQSNDWHAFVAHIGKTQYSVEYTETSRSPTIAVTIDGVKQRATVVRAGSEIHVFTMSGNHSSFTLPTVNFSQSETASGGPIAAMSGKIIKVNVQVGDQVTKNQTLVIMEAMKMEHVIKAATGGTVSAVHYKVGDFVEGGKVLCQIAAGGNV